MEQAKEKIIADLYALRAGLSVISGYSSEIKTLENKNRQMHQLCVKVEDECTETQNEIERLENELKTGFPDNDPTIEELNKSIEVNKSKVSSLEKKRDTMSVEVTPQEKKLCKKGKDTQKFVWASILMLFAVGCTVGMLVMSIVVPDSTVSLLFIWLPGMGAYYSLKLWKDIKDGRASWINGAISRIREKKGQERDAVQEEINNLKQRNCDLSTLVQKKKQDLWERQEAHKRLIAETRKKLVQKEEVLCKQRLICSINQVASVKGRTENDEKIGALVENSKTLKGALDKTYGIWIAESDWENIDFLIYYLETGRADTFKEALLSLDDQKRTNQIVNAISAAKISISQTVTTAMSRLGRALSTSFSIISSQLEKIERSTRETTKEIRRLGGRLEMQNEEIISSYEGVARATAEQTARLESKFNEQISESKLNSALVEKANKTSRELLNDLRYNQRLWIK